MGIQVQTGFQPSISSQRSRSTIKKEKRFSHSKRDEFQEHIQQFLKKEDVSPDLNQKTIDIAKEVVDCLPSFVPEPGSVYPTARGEITLDWVLSRNNMLSLGISPEGEIAYSGISKIKGTEKWTSQLPSTVLHWFKGASGYLTKTDG